MTMVFDEMLIEREKQMAKGYRPAHDDLHSPNDWIAILTRHLGLAANDGGKADPERFRKQMIRVGAIAAAAVESKDRLDEAKRNKPAGDHAAGSGF